MRISDWSSDVCSSDLAQAQSAALVGMSEKAQNEATALNAVAEKATASIVIAGDTAQERSAQLSAAAGSVVDRTLELRSTIHEQAGALTDMSTELSRHAKNHRQNFRIRVQEHTNTPDTLMLYRSEARSAR